MHLETSLEHGALQIGPLVEHHRDATARLLARTFDGDAAYQYLFPVAGARERGLADFFARNLRTHLPYRCTHVAYERSGEPLATVTLRPPGGVPISLFTMLRQGLMPFALAHGGAAVKRLLWLKDTYDALEARVGHGAPHWHVHMMAVRRDRQGRGVGSALLRRVLEATATSPHPAVLTTHLPENVVFYRRAGFEVFAHDRLEPPRSAAYQVWSMRRAPSVS